MDNRHPNAVEDYTVTNLVLIFVNMLWVFAAIWTVWGLPVVVLLALVLNHMITRLEYRKARNEARFTRFERPSSRNSGRD
ncbi:histidinol phosphate aminotransferase [Pacificoceanicola onchidii]|uniref:histidinol phosphate aminotransferase n=1 Tax=Pacificoceanicola onchidii TaxID=2562685 RepID=UPI0010A3A482|nr:histidinol phosphate aminotransferase [Pacificoceanicola onchidii]